MKDRITTYRARLQAGNAIVMLFAAVGVAGLIGYGLNTVMRGPAVTTAELSRHTIAENNLVATSRLAIAMSARGHPAAIATAMVSSNRWNTASRLLPPPIRPSRKTADFFP